MGCLLLWVGSEQAADKVPIDVVPKEEPLVAQEPGMVFVELKFIRLLEVDLDHFWRDESEVDVESLCVAEGVSRGVRPL